MVTCVYNTQYNAHNTSETPIKTLRIIHKYINYLLIVSFPQIIHSMEQYKLNYGQSLIPVSKQNLTMRKIVPILQRKFGNDNLE